MHCDLATHIAVGLGVQFLEGKGQIKLPDANWKRTCQNWKTYYNGHPAYLKDDSGLL